MGNAKKAIWDAVKRPPKDALSPIKAGRLKGKSDINPQWRYDVMTEQFGMCGDGWKFEIEQLWITEGSYDQKVQHAKILLYVKVSDKWSDPIPGIGGSMLIAKETGGLHTNDEAVKMAITDALSTAMKMIGVAADIYRGIWDGLKYKEVEGNKRKEYKNFQFLEDMSKAKIRLNEITGNDNLYYMNLEDKGYKKSSNIEPQKQKAALKHFNDLVKEKETN